MELVLERYRITTQPGDDPTATEQTWVLLPDQPSAVIQAEELAQRKKMLHVRVYHEVTGAEPVLTLDLPARQR